MAITDGLKNMAVRSGTLTSRQEDVADLVRRYREVAKEPPSAGWLSRRMGISRQRAQQHLDALRLKGWL